MGMAASQARLLTLTARMSDNELRSQTINNAKMRLATQSSQASEAYINALNNATLKFTNYDEAGTVQGQTLTYNALTAYSSYNTQYGLVNAAGQLLVSEKEAGIFTEANGNLNEFLKKHGLEYTTTYFDLLPTHVNDKYPAPFNSVENTTLQKWYEEYGSYENSIEVETYKTAAASFQEAEKALIQAMKDPYEAYLGYVKGSGTTPSTPAGYKINTSQSVSEIYNNLKGAWNNGANSYSPLNTTTQKFLNADFSSGNRIMDLIRAEIQKYQPSGSNLVYKNPTNIQSTTDSSGNKSYTISDYLKIETDSTGKVTSISCPGFGTPDPANPNYNRITDMSGNPIITESSPTYTGGSYTFPSILTQLKYEERSKDSSGSIVTTATYNFGNYKTVTDPETGSTYETIDISETTSGDEAKDRLEGLNDTLVQIMKDNVDYAKFAQQLLLAYNNPSHSNIWNNPLTLVTGDLQTLIENYIETKNIFLGVIFDDPSKIESAIDNGDVIIGSLREMDYALEVLKKYGLDMSKEFETVVKQYIVDEVTLVNGEPKYSWVDENDTGNTGNADSKAQWYTNLFKRMQKGFKALENGLASSDKWIEYALENGIVTMEQVDKSFNWKTMDYKTCSKITEETDDAAVAKAEAEYTRAMNDIEAKDNMYDIQLKNIDTEHNALQTEYDSIKTVISKNIERTFKFDQSA